VKTAHRLLTCEAEFTNSVHKRGIQNLLWQEPFKGEKGDFRVKFGKEGLGVVKYGESGEKAIDYDPLALTP
jgi:hypothetical protein